MLLVFFIHRFWFLNTNEQFKIYAFLDSLPNKKLTNKNNIVNFIYIFAIILYKEGIVLSEFLFKKILPEISVDYKTINNNINKISIKINNPIDYESDIDIEKYVKAYLLIFKGYFNLKTETFFSENSLPEIFILMKDIICKETCIEIVENIKSKKMPFSIKPQFYIDKVIKDKIRDFDVKLLNDSELKNFLKFKEFLFN